jgi:hypothetical protein
MPTTESRSYVQISNAHVKVRYSLHASLQHQLQPSRVPATYYKNPNMVREYTYEAHSQILLSYIRLSVDKNHYMKWLTATLDYLELPSG